MSDEEKTLLAGRLHFERKEAKERLRLLDARLQELGRRLSDIALVLNPPDTQTHLPTEESVLRLLPPEISELVDAGRIAALLRERRELRDLVERLTEQLG